MNREKRLSNIELLRIITMLLIIGSHFSTHGIMHFSEPDKYDVFMTGSRIKQIITCLYVPGGEVGVAIFFMITGYFQIDREKVSVKRVIMESLFYGIFCMGIFIILRLASDSRYILEQKLSFSNVVKGIITPISGGTWWYVTAYTLIMIMSPAINKIINACSRKGLLLCLAFVLCVWYGISYFCGGTYYSLQRGILFYMLGAYCKKWTIPLNKGSRITCIIMAAFSWSALSFLFYYFSMNEYSIAIQLMDLLKLVVCIPVCSISVFKIFESFDIGYNKYINLLASTTLGVYLLHDFGYLRLYLWHEIVKSDVVYLNGDLYPAIAPLVIIGIFLICSLIDILRQKIFEPYAMKMADCIIKYITSK